MSNEAYVQLSWSDLASCFQMIVVPCHYIIKVFVLNGHMCMPNIYMMLKHLYGSIWRVEVVEIWWQLTERYQGITERYQGIQDFHSVYYLIMASAWPFDRYCIILC